MSYGYLRSNAQITVVRGPYIEILPVNPDYIVVPYYDPLIVLRHRSQGRGRIHDLSRANSSARRQDHRHQARSVIPFAYPEQTALSEKQPAREPALTLIPPAVEAPEGLALSCAFL